MTHFLKRDTMRITGGKMIMLDMMPTLISCKTEYLHPETFQKTFLSCQEKLSIWVRLK